MKALPTPPTWVVLALIALSVVLAALPRLLSPTFSRPFEQDELVTLGSTSAGMFETVDELQKRPRFDVKEALAGFVRPFAGRWDPNYHIAHSWVLSLTTLVTGYGEAQVRLPALGFFLAGLALLQWLVWKRSGSWLLMLLSGAFFAVLPFNWLYAITARGYTLMVLMVLAQFALLRPEIWRRLGASWVFLALSGLNILLFLNLASLIFMWIAPFSLALLLAPAPRPDEVPGGPNSDLLRSRWNLSYRLGWGQFAGLGFVSCGIFLLCKLHDFIAAQSRYGVSLPTRRAAMVELEGAMVWLLPGAGYLLLLLALGLAISLYVRWIWKRQPLPPIALAALFSAGACAAYSLATQKVAWDRNYGFVIPVVLLLLAEGWALAAAWKTLWARQLAQGLIALALLAGIISGWRQTRDEIALGTTTIQAYSVLAHDLSAQLRSGKIPTEPIPYIVKPYSWDVNAYLPSAPDTLHRIEPREGVPVQFLFLLEKPNRLKWFWLRTLTWETNSSNDVNLPVEALGEFDYVLRHNLRAVGRKVLIPRAHGTGARVIGLLLQPAQTVNREALLTWLRAQAPDDYFSARVSIQNYRDQPTSLIFWVTPQWPRERWETVLKTFPAPAPSIWRLEEPPARTGDL